MPLANRIDPFGRRAALPGRGLFTGNRGCLVSHAGAITRASASPAWLICTLVWRQARQPLAAPHTWTPLFFLDEATAFAAGHRPCARCRRPAFQALLAATGHRRAAELDRVLAVERRAERPMADPRTLPLGAMVADGLDAYLVAAEGVRRWSMAGYGPPEPWPAHPLPVLTPALHLAALANGYPIVIQGSGHE